MSSRSRHTLPVWMKARPFSLVVVRKYMTDNITGAQRHRATVIYSNHIEHRIVKKPGTRAKGKRGREVSVNEPDIYCIE